MANTIRGRGYELVVNHIPPGEGKGIVQPHTTKRRVYTNTYHQAKGIYNHIPPRKGIYKHIPPSEGYSTTTFHKG